MEKIQFAVSAKTARLIGRENISDVDSAVIELIKNSYDADATCVFIDFNMPFPFVPRQISFELASTVFGENGLATLLTYYERTEKVLSKKINLSEEDEKKLERLLFSKNCIIVLDNGHGMDCPTLKTAWMNIGTNSKEQRNISPGGRIKTGAKGIGRFALDKLSTQTTVYTKSANDELLKWSIDWNQFETATLLEDVDATLELLPDEFKTHAQHIAEKKIESFDEYLWDTGTIIILTPTREVWSSNYFDKMNKNIKSLFSYSNDFDIYVSNHYFPRYKLNNERFTLQDSEYDYKIEVYFDGNDKLKVMLSRNEVDTRKMKFQIIISDIAYDLQLNEFWKREAFEKEHYKRSDYAKTIIKEFSASDLLKQNRDSLSEVGPFFAELYFLKNANSTVDIIKQINFSKRKEVLSNYSGVKLYRDGFKVRPYGEDGPVFDWLGLGKRAQKSPAGVSDLSGSWRVQPYQLIGAVRISRANNPNLKDMANREGLAINNAYTTFVAIIEKTVETFEGDRQYIYREYAQWSKLKMTELSKAAEVVESIKAKQEKEDTDKQIENYPIDTKNKASDNDYSRVDYENAVSYLEEEKERQTRTTQTIMLFSSAGVMTNTFSHEISRIATDAGSRMQQLRTTIVKLLGKEGYIGDQDYNPFLIIDEAEKTDQLLESWINIIMNGIKDAKFVKTQVPIQKVIKEIIDLWKPLLEKKYISIELVNKNLTEDSKLDIAEVDIYIILNNFLLNSAWFLEATKAEIRKITITIYDKDGNITLLLVNNGPPLDSIFSNNPEKIFDAGVTTKKIDNNEGTGLGLWITKAVVENNSGQIHPMIMSDGFGLKISLPK